ncbi:murein hydrolase activator EnvC family protein [uncultured Enterovirga sp.]|uniref:murein hydrolase activator EnvC family protein n=1 Tax=uncultured Enterovirga sp. TaxID=2026352 RepID=UPI0035CA9F4C
MTRARLAWAASLVALLSAAGTALPQDAPSGPALESPAPAGAAERAQREDALRILEQRARQSGESRRRLEAEIAAIRSDRPKLSAALLDAAARARAAEERARTAERRLDSLLAGEADLRRSLADRRGLIAEVLAALQRMGRNPAPALLLRAEDILEAVRAATMLGAVMPGLREQARVLATDLAELVRFREAILADRLALDSEFVALAGERDRLAVLIQARQERLAAAEGAIGNERSRAESLGAEARTLRELIDRMEGEASRERRAAEEARAATDVEARQARERFAAAAARDPVRLTPRQPFAETRGLLIRPAAGSTLRDFGAPDGSGGVLRGSALATRPRAVVTTPADGWIVFAGPFRSYGRLLIINAGGGYYLLLAGMDQINVRIGQFVLAGEPVGQMGEVAAASAALGVVEADGPVLYVELRKDGNPIDSGPWWAKSQAERARG